MKLSVHLIQADSEQQLEKLKNESNLACLYNWSHDQCNYTTGERNIVFNSKTKEIEKISPNYHSQEKFV